MRYQGGLDYWTFHITACGTDVACVPRRGFDVSAAYFVGLEFQRTEYVVYRLFRAARGTVPNTITGVRINYSQFNSDRGQLGDGAGLSQSTIIDALNNGDKTRAPVLLDVIEIREFKTREYNAGICADATLRLFATRFDR